MNMLTKETFSNYLTIEEFIKSIFNEIKEKLSPDGIIINAIDYDKRVIKYLFDDLHPAIKLIFDSSRLSEYSLDSDMNICFSIKENKNSYKPNMQDVSATENDRRITNIFGTKSSYVFLFRKDNIPYAYINVFYFLDERKFSDKMLIEIENYIQSLENRFYELLVLFHEKEKNKKFQHLADNIDTIYEFGTIINNIRDLQEAFTLIIKELSKLYGIEAGTVYLIDKDKNVIDPIIYDAEYFKRFTDYELRSKEFIKRTGVAKIPYNNFSSAICVCALNKSPMYMKNVQELMHIPMPIVDRASLEIFVPDIKTNILIPLLINNEPIGTLQLFTYTKIVDLSPDDIDTIVRLSNFVATAINNSRLYAEVNKKSIEIEKINEITKEISSSLDFDTVFQKVVDYLATNYGFEGCGFALVNDDRLSYKFVKGFMPDFVKDSEKLFVGKTFPLNEKGGGIAICIIEKKLYYFPEIDLSSIKNEVSKEYIRRQQMKSALNVPVSIGDEVIGAFTLTGHSQPIYLTDEDIESIQRFTNQIAVLLRNSKLFDELKRKNIMIEQAQKTMQDDLTLAKRIQFSIISDDKKFPSLNTEIIYKPMLEVGGDIYDVFMLKENYYRIMIADATGHGVQAALITMIIKTEYEKIKVINNKPNIILSLLNNSFIENYYNLNMFFTTIIVDIDFAKNKIYYSSAGHPQPVVIREGALKQFNPGDKIIGITLDQEYRLEVDDFNKTDRLLLFTDGVFEEFSPDGEEFGEARFLDLVKKYINLPIKNIVNNILKDVKDWCFTTSLTDDVTIIGIEYKDEVDG